MEEIIKKRMLLKEVEKALGTEKYNYIMLLVEIKDVVDNKDDEALDIKKLKELLKIIERKDENIDLAIDLFMLISELEGVKKKDENIDFFFISKIIDAFND